MEDLKIQNIKALIRWHFYQNDSFRVSNLCDNLLISGEHKGEDEDVVEFLYYHYKSKLNLMLSSSIVLEKSLLNRLKGAKFSVSEAEY